MIVSWRMRTPGLAMSRYGSPDRVERRATEHHIELRVAEDERLALVDHRYAGVLPQSLGKHRGKLQTAKPGAEDENARVHTADPCSET